MIYKLMDDPQQFNAFVQNHPYSHFQKTSMWGEFIQKTEHNPYRMLGFFEHNQLVATAMLLVKKHYSVIFSMFQKDHVLIIKTKN